MHPRVYNMLYKVFDSFQETQVFETSNARGGFNACHWRGVAS